jgi:hypothetical protein
MMRPATLLFVLLAGGMTLGLFTVKYEVQHLEGELIRLDRSIAADREALHVLEAEWSHLNNPARLRPLAARHLDLMPVEARNMGGLSTIPEKPPAKTESQTQ